MRRAVLAFIALLSIAVSGTPAAASCAGGTCFWIGGAGTLNLTSDSAHWSTSSGGTTCSCEPASTDDIVWDGNSGVGTVTVNIAGGTMTVGSLNFLSTAGGPTQTIDFATNNNNVTIKTATLNQGTATVNMGSGTWSITQANGNIWVIGAGITLNANTSTLSFTGTPTGTRGFNGGGKTYSTFTINSGANGAALWNTTIAASNTFATLNITAPNVIDVASGSTQTITTLTNVTGSNSTQVLLDASSPGAGNQFTISSANNWTCTWCAVRDAIFSGGGTFTANSSFNFGDNSGITINGPSAGGGGGSHIIGSGL